MSHKPYKRFVWHSYDELYTPGIDDVLEEDEESEFKVELEEDVPTVSELDDESEELVKIFRYALFSGKWVLYEHDLEPPEWEPYELDLNALGWEPYEFASEVPEMLHYREALEGLDLFYFETEIKEDDEKEKLVALFKLGDICLSDRECAAGKICVSPPGKEHGICVPIGEISVVIAGILDSRTCDYCRSQIGKVGTLDSINLPPYHKHCRCFARYI